MIVDDSMMKPKDFSSLQTGLELEKFCVCIPDGEFTIDEMRDICIANEIFPKLIETSLRMYVSKCLHFLTSIGDLSKIRRIGGRKGCYPDKYIKNRS